MSLEGKAAIVTGSSRGIGKAISLSLAKEGANIVVSARTEREEESKFPGTIYETADEIKELGSKALPVKTDMTKDKDIENMVNRTLNEFGKVDILVNNAGVDALGTVLDMPIKRWDLIMDIHLRGTYLCTKHVLEDMVKRKSGHIVNLSSIVAAQRGGKSIASLAYAVAKAAIERFTYGLADELREHNIAVNALCPGLTATEGMEFFWPKEDKSDWYTSEFWGKACAFICKQSPETLTGEIITGDEFKGLRAMEKGRKGD